MERDKAIEKAYILKNGDVVRNDGFSKLIYSATRGYLAGFTTKRGDSYIHVNKTNFRKEDKDILEKYEEYNGSSPAGYYSESDFLRYLHSESSDSYSESDLALVLHNFKYKFSDFIPAQNEDSIVIHLLRIDKDVKKYERYYQKLEFKFDSNFNYTKKYSNGTVKSYNHPDGVIITYPLVDTGETANLFYKNKVNEYVITNVILSVNSDKDEKKEACLYLAKFAYIIKSIEARIFNLFPDKELFNNLISTQKNYWKTENIFKTDNPSIADFEKSFNSIYNFYHSANKNRLKIQASDGDDKLYYLVVGMSSLSLSSLHVQTKITILKHLINSGKLNPKFNRDIPENIVLRIIDSFSPDINRKNYTDANIFLDWLITTPEGTDKTYYELLYIRMSTSFNITKTLIGISNWLKNTDFKPRDTKDAYVRGLYAIWQHSKYNPYDALDNLKPNMIGFKSINPALDGNVSRSGGPYMYTYTLVSGYESFPSSEDLKCKKWPQFCTTKRFFKEASYADEASPIAIAYDSVEFGGIFLDPFVFKFKKDKIQIYELKPVSYKPPVDEDNNNIPDNDKDKGYINKNSLLFGTYDIYQPLTLLNTNLETSVPIITTTGNPEEINGTTINSVIPAFVLKFIDRDGDRSDAQKILGYTIDGILTLSGIANLTKLKHLKWFGGKSGLFSMNFVRVVIGGVEFTSGVLSFIGNFIDCKDNETCKNIKKILLIAEIASGGLDAIDSIATAALKKQARNTVSDAGGGANDTERINNLKKELEAIDKELPKVEGAPPTSPEIINKTAETIVNVAKYGRRVEEFTDLLNLLENLGYKNLRKKLLEIKGVNEEAAYAFMDAIKREEEVFKILDKNTKFLDDVNSIDKAKNIAKFANILGEIKPSMLSRIGIKKDGPFHRTFFNQEFNDTDIKNVIELFMDLELTDLKLIEDFIVMACRARTKKKSTRYELMIQINYYVKVVLARGFPSGFASLSMYKLFCNKARNYFESIPLFKGKVLEYRVQGSVLKQKDIKDPVDPLNIPFREKRKPNSLTEFLDGVPMTPDDLDVDIIMNKADVKELSENMKTYWRNKIDRLDPELDSKTIDKLELKINAMDKGIDKGVLHKSLFNDEPFDFYKPYRKAIKDNGKDIFQAVSSKGKNRIDIGFAIIIKDSAYDVKPNMPFKY